MRSERRRDGGGREGEVEGRMVKNQIDKMDRGEIKKKKKERRERLRNGKEREEIIRERKRREEKGREEDERVGSVAQAYR